MQPKAKIYRFRATSSASLFESRNCLFILAVNWLLQGMRGMDPKELGFRLLLLALLAGLAAWLLAGLLGLPGLTALALGLGIGHTLNFLLNGQLWVVLRYCPGYRRIRPGSRLDQRPARRCGAAGLARRGRAHGLDRDPAGDTAIPRRHRSPADLPAGGRGLAAHQPLPLAPALSGRLPGLPLDLYAYEHPAVLRRFDQREPLGIILDREVRLKRGFANRRLVWLR
jgi:hypothetical protein